MATLYKASGIIRDVQPTNGEWFTLNELQDHVGGMIENMPVHPERKEKGLGYLCNENGLAEMLKPNQFMTMFLGYVCVGDILEIEDKEWR